MNYNTKREAIIMREYGRSVQRYVDFAKNIVDKAQRQTAAENIIQMMSSLNPQLKYTQDYKQKLWSQLLVMSNFELDVDVPDSVPTSAEAAQMTPSPIPYPRSNIRMKNYGKNVESLIEKAVQLKDEEQKEELVHLIANFMKLTYKNWSNEEVNNHLIREDLRTISRGGLIISDDMHIEITAPTGNPQGNKKRNAQNKGKNNSSYSRNRNNKNNKRFR
ncbi:MAG: DUF4290 domain-containing protein [Chitinophagales bacterium]|nr:DUF4290 domain-containing protein [Chitinophagales bacterium]MCZ2393960.1 DUF4290 domain-containing protein [Chitinophagales bacterium]